MANEFIIRKGLVVNGSGSTVVDIQGSQGQLFSITDDLTGTLFAVSDISGIPVFQVDASGESLFDGNLSVSGSLRASGSASHYLVGANVGIGTTSPSEKLHIEDIANPKLLVKDSNGAGIYLQAFNSYGILSSVGSTSTLRLGINDLEKMRINSDGYVGIGTTNPTSKLHIVETGTIAAALKIDTTRYGASIVGDGTSNTQYLLNLQSNGGSTEVMRVQSSGNVGIGTTSPVSRLEVHSVATSTYPFKTQGANSNNVVSFYDSTVGGEIYMEDSSGNVDVKISTGASSYFKGGNFGINTASPQGNLHVNGVSVISANDTAYNNGYFTKIRSYFSANPFVLESRAGTLMQAEDFGRTLAFYAGPDGSTSEVMRVDESGNVGIGTTNPQRPLHIETPVGNDTNELLWLNANDILTDIVMSDTTGSIRIRNNGGALQLQTGGVANNPNPGASNRLTIDTSGNVGIGTTSPGSELHVEGDVRIGSNKLKLGGGNADSYIQHDGINLITFFQSNWGGDFKFRTADFSGIQHDILFIEGTNQRVGIGTTSPSYTLDVSGSGRFTDGLTVTGSLIHDGDLTVTGKVTAQEFHTQFVSASIIYQSGSTKFGDTSDDIHEFTGSLEVSSSIKMTKTGHLYDYPLEITNDSIKLPSNNSSARSILRQGGTSTGGFLSLVNGSGNETAIIRSYSNAGVQAFFTAGNVGIGTTSPADRLHVVGSQRIDQSADWDGLNIYGFDDQSSDYLKLHIGTSPMARYQSNLTHSFYVGTSRNLDIAATAIAFKVNTSYSDDLMSIFGNNKDSYIGYSNTDNRLKIGFGSLSSPTVDSNTKLSLDASGVYVTDNLGIGTTSPAYKLSVSEGTIGTDFSSTSVSVGRQVNMTSANTSGMGVFTRYTSNTDATPDYFGQYGFYFNGGTSSAAKQYQLYVGDAVNPRMIMTAGGRMGIGTTAPSYPLEVNGGTLNTIANFKSTDAGAYISFSDNSTTSGEYVQIGASGDGMVIRTGNAQAVTIASDGDVGIGTTAPNAKFHVEGTTILGDDFSTTTTYINKLSAPSVFSDQAGNRLSIAASGTTVTEGPAIISDGRNLTIGSYDNGEIDSGIRFNHTNNTPNSDTVEILAASEVKLIVSASGDVGIGTTEPTWKVHISAPALNESNLLSSDPAAIGIKAVNSSNLAAIDFGFYDSGTPARNTVPQARIATEFTGIGSKFHFIGSRNFTTGLTQTSVTIAEDGSIGIGTTAPALQSAGTGMHVSAATSSEIKFTTNTSGHTATDGTALVANGTGFTINNREAGYLSLGTNNSPRLYIDSDGDVGIGTTGPTAKLDVRVPNGSVPSLRIGRSDAGSYWDVYHAGNDFRLFNNDGTGSDILFGIDPSGTSFDNKVGIGVAVPAAKLHVDGDAIITGKVTAQEFHTEFVSASIIYQSGSTKFGDTSDDVHSFTGSLVVQSGSVDIPFGSAYGYKINTNRILSQTSGVFEFGALDYKSIYPNIAVQSDNTFRVLSNGSTLLYVTGSGNVGIGTTSPGYKLSISGPSSSQLEIINSANSKSWRPNVNGNDFYITETGVGNPFVIQAGGNVGIGTTSPTTKLHVSGGEALFEDRVSIFNLDATDNPRLVLGRQNAESLNFDVEDVNGYIYMKQDADGDLDQSVRFGLQTASTGTHSYRWYFSDAARSSEYTKMVLTSEGRLLLGVTTPIDLPNTLKKPQAEIEYSGYGGLYIHGNNSGLAGANSSSFGLVVSASNHTVTNGGAGYGAYIEARSTTFSNTKNYGVYAKSVRRGRAGSHPAIALFGHSTHTPITDNIDMSSDLVGVWSKVDFSDDSIAVTSSAEMYNFYGEAIVPANKIIDDYYGLFLKTPTVNGTITNTRYGIYQQGTSEDNYFAGNVGIGTTSPTDELSVVGTVNASSLLATNPSNTSFTEGAGATNGQIYLSPTRGNRSLSITTQQLAAGDDIDGVAFNAFYTNTGAPVDLLFRNGGNNNFYIKSTGNVGIGTTNPSAKLQIEGSAFLNSGILKITNNSITNYYDSDEMNSYGTYYDWKFAGSIVMRINSSGNVGIGTTSPSEKLHVIGNVKFDGDRDIDFNTNDGFIKITPNTGGWATGYYFNGSSGTSRGGFGGFGNDDTLIYYWIGDAWNDTTMVVQPNAGNVGIGTTSPSQKLHVVGNARVTGAYYDSNNSAGISGQVLSSTATGTDWVSLSEISGVDGTGTANYVAKWSDADTITNSVIYDNGTNVGIGTTSLAAQLHVNKSTEGEYFRAGSGGIRELRFTSYTATSEHAGHKIDASSVNGEIALATGGTARITINSSGNVGIGTTSPEAKLHVASTDSSYVAKFSHTTATGYAPGSILLQAGQSVSRGQGLFHYNTEADESWFTGVPYSVNSRKWIVANKPDTTFNPDVAQLSYAFLTIDSDNGNVGIGTTSPGQKLHVSGNARVTGALEVNYGVSTADASINVGVSRTDSGYAYLDLIGDTTYSNYGLRIIRGNAGANATSDITHRGTGDFGINTVEASALKFRTSNTERMRITSAGNVGIGTTSPSEKLHVKGNILVEDNDSTDTVVRIGNSGDDGWINLYANGVSTAFVGANTVSYFNGGNVGIGTTAPDEKLEVSGEIKISGGDYNGLYFENATGTTKTLLYQHAAYDALVIKDIVNNADRVTFKNNGNVGIGTTTPAASAILDIASTTKGVVFPRMSKVQRASIISPTTGLIVYQTDSQEGLYIYKSTGWVQII